MLKERVDILVKESTEKTLTTKHNIIDIMDDVS